MNNLNVKLLFLLLPIVFIAKANDTIFYCNFEQELQIVWGETMGNNLEKFEISETAKINGTRGFHVKFAPNSGTKANLTTPKNLNFVAGEKYLISFNYKAIIPDNENNSIIKLSYDASTREDNLYLSYSSKSVARYEKTIISQKTSSEGYILFTFRPNNAGEGEFYIDDIVIEKVVPKSNFFTDLKTKNVISDSTIVWTQFGPGMSGNNKSAFWHPTDKNVLFIAPNMGNSYRSLDQGKTYETMLKEDGPYHKSYLRGPVDIRSMDFSRQDENFGFCTDERRGGLYVTINKGKSWDKLLNVPPKMSEAYLSCVAVNPNNDSIWYVGAGLMRDLAYVDFPYHQPRGSHVDAKSQGLVWITKDKGSTWTQISNGINSNCEIETIYVDPNNSQVVYMASNYGFYKSRNEGQSWESKNNGLDSDVLRSFAIHHNKTNGALTFYVINPVMWGVDGTMVVDSIGGIFKSTDLGESWTKINGDLAMDLTHFSNDYNVRKEYFKTLGNYFKKSATEVESMYPTLSNHLTHDFVQITVDPTNPDNLFLVCLNSFEPGRMWKSKDGGKHWYVNFRMGKRWNLGADLSYWQSRNNPIGNNVNLRYKKYWELRDDYVRKYCNFSVFNADGSILHTQLAKISLMSYDKGETWVDIDDEKVANEYETWVGAGNSNVPGHGFYQTPLIPKTVFCCSGENSLWITRPGGDGVRKGAQAASVHRLTEGEHSVSSVAVHPQNRNIMFATFFRQEQAGFVRKSIDGGLTWNNIGDPLPKPWPESSGGDESIHQLSFLIHKNNPDEMFFCVPRNSKRIEYVGNSVGYWGIHKSIDGGKTWTQPNNGLPESLDIARLAYSQTCDTLFAAVMGKNGGLFMTDDGAENWTEVTSTSSISGTYGINDIHFAVDGKVYITAGDKNAGPDEGGVWVSDDGLKTWTKIFDFPWVNRIEVAKYDPKTILISTLANNNTNLRNAGTYLSKDGGVSWVKCNIGNGQADRINDIAIDYYEPGKYYASTYGSGWYMARDTNAIPKIIPADSISVSVDTLFLFKGETYQLTASVNPETATFKNIHWSSENKSCASISYDGLVKANEVGETRIEAFYPFQELKKEIIVIVRNTVGINDLPTSNLMVFPNPASNELTIATNNILHGELQLSIYNIRGSFLKQIIFNDLDPHKKVDITDLMPGVYTLFLQNDKMNCRGVFIKQ